jgi:hypothetical protein
MDWKITHRSPGLGFKHWATYYECNEYNCCAIVIDKLSGEQKAHDVHKSTVAAQNYNEDVVVFSPEQGQYSIIREKLIKILQDLYADGYDSTDAIHNVRTTLELFIVIKFPDIRSGKTMDLRTKAHSFDIKPRTVT